MNEKSLDYISIDFETANFNQNSACSIGLVRFIDGKECASFSTLICPPTDYFVQRFTDEIHHISYQDVKDKCNFYNAWISSIYPFISEVPDLPLVAHNAGFDMKVLRACLDFYQIPKTELKYFDSLAISRKVWPDFDSHRLTFLGKELGIEYLAHDALEDARSCGIVVAKAAEIIGAVSVRDLLKKISCKLKTFK